MIQKIMLNHMTKSNEKMGHLYFKQSEHSDTLVAIFPGGNYSCERPLLHYLRKSALNKNFDVLSINYGDAFKDFEFGVCLFDEMAYEAKKVLEICLSKNTYRKVVLVGKSIGTTLIGRIRDEMDLGYDVKQIYLTPIRESIEDMKRYNGLVITGTKDKLFSIDMVNQVKEMPKNIIKMFEGANHALELEGDISKTIDLHKEILKICSAYLT